MKVKDITVDKGNPVAKVLRTTNMFRQQVVPSGKGKGSYKRKQKHKGKGWA